MASVSGRTRWQRLATIGHTRSPSAAGHPPSFDDRLGRVWHETLEEVLTVAFFKGIYAPAFAMMDLGYAFCHGTDLHLAVTSRAGVSIHAQAVAAWPPPCVSGFFCRTRGMA